MKVWHNLYPKLITKKNIFRGWREFLVGKKKKKDVIYFQHNLEENLSTLYTSLKKQTYKPGLYTGFYVCDPKIRLIHKATVPDRVVHHIVSIILEKIYEPTFYAHSYSCRKDKGTHRGVIALQKMAKKVSKNNTRTCWVLKCDIKKFFASVNQRILFEILKRRIKDQDFLELLHKIINGFYSDRTIDLSNKKGIPIGNLTSQLFSNIYMDDLDQFIKHKLKIKYYIRYADDFMILSHDKTELEDLVGPIQTFLKHGLDLDLHPDKIIYRKLTSGVDFLGYIVFPYYILPRTKTKRRLIKKIRRKVKEYKRGKISKDTLNQTIQSYLGYLSHADAYKFKQQLQNLIWFWLTE